jgi:peptidoglycan/xylan/chitin deacetylase (PgdA/CDA1 family)
MGIHEAAKVCCERLGLLAAFHRAMNHQTLTVVMFHRVLPAETMGGADPDYTIDEALFGQCLSFFRRHYAIVGIDDVLSARGGRTRLGGPSLLITFDDGWDDNLDFAVPHLVSASMPALVFACADAVMDDQPGWWQEVLLAALRQGRASYGRLWNAVPGGGGRPPASEPVLDLLVRYGCCSAEIRHRALAPLAGHGVLRQILTPARLEAVAAAGMAVGSHGAAHLPLTMIADPLGDMQRSRQILGGLLGERFSEVFSFPHGRHSPEVMSAAFSAGFKLAFTSDALLNRLVAGKPAAILGRIEIPAKQISDGRGRLQPESLATWLFLRHRHHLGSLRSLALAQGGPHE